jgi:hypothetical protein
MPIPVFLRELGRAEGRNAPRYSRAFEGVDPARWHILKEGEAWPLS